MPTTFQTLAARKSELIRRGLEGITLVAPYSAAAVTAMTTGATGALNTTAFTGYKPLGWGSSAGVTFTPTVTKTNVSSWGSTDPTRSDTTSDITTMAVVAQETNLTTLATYLGVDLSATTTTATTGELSIQQPARPATRYYRVLQITRDDDTNGAGDIYIGRFFPKAYVSDRAAQTHSDSDVPIEFGLTFTPVVDSVLGYAQAYLWGGPGWKAQVVNMGFPATT